jgi:hypothetical protein
VVVGSDLELSGERFATRGYGEVEGDFPGDAVKRIKDITGYRRDPNDGLAPPSQDRAFRHWPSLCAAGKVV